MNNAVDNRSGMALKDSFKKVAYKKGQKVSLKTGAKVVITAVFADCSYMGEGEDGSVELFHHKEIATSK